MSDDQTSILSPSLFLKMIFTGGKQIIQSENELNQLNVYPVPDGDTGSNMAALMRYMVAQDYPTENFGNLLAALADASLIGSCGNSGMILSAFFVGFAKLTSIAEKASLSITDFTDCLASGVRQAHESVANPVEGTILTVMQSWLDACMNQRAKSHHFTALFQSTLPVAEATLTQTEFLLPTLKENHVIDAGALGFIKLIQGMNQALHEPKSFDVHWEEHETRQISFTTHVHHAKLAPDAYQFCMETLLAGTHENLDILRQEMEPFCDSIVLNQSPSHIKTHAHTTDIMQCTKLLKRYGKILHQKIDDIKSQSAITEHRKHDIAIVTDSSADLPHDFTESMQIHTIPIQVRIGENALLDRLTINLDDLFEDAAKPGYKTGTSAPSSEIVRRYLQFLASHYKSIIVISISSRLSSTFQIMQNQAEHVSHATGVKINVVDSHQLCAGHGLLVMKAAKMLELGCMHDEIVQTLLDMRNKIKNFVVIDELKTMRESGRVSKLMHKIADWGHVKPILSIDKSGQASVAGVALGKQKAWKKIAAITNKQLKNMHEYTLLISHTTTMDAINEFADYLKSSIGARITGICDTAPSLGVHAGRGAIAIAFCDETFK